MSAASRPPTASGTAEFGSGEPPVTATVSNALGLIPGSISGAIGYRRELRGQRGRVLKFGSGALLGGLAGATLLLTLPADAFETVVPVLVGLALLLVRTPLRLLLTPLAAAGSMPLSLYTAHVLVLATTDSDDPTRYYLLQVSAALVLAVLWRRWVGRGPLELLLATHHASVEPGHVVLPALGGALLR